MRRLSQSDPRRRALSLGGALALLTLAAAPSMASAAAGDLTIVGGPGLVLPDDSVVPDNDVVLSGNGRYLATTETRYCVSIAPDYDDNTDCNDEQHIWRYDLRTGARAKVNKGGFVLGGARSPQLSFDGNVAAWTSFSWFADADTNHVFRSRVDTGQAGQDTIPYAGAQGPGGTWWPEFITSPSLSADGKTLALDSNAYGGGCSQPQLWSGPDLTGATAPTITTLASCAEGNTSPGPFTGQVPDTGFASVLSGDGTTIAYLSETKIYRYDVATGVTTAFPFPAGQPGPPRELSISGDGKTLVFTTPTNVHPEGYSIGVALWTLDLTTGATTAIASLASGEVFSEAQISGNGRYIAFTWSEGLPGTPNDSEYRVYLYDRTTATFRRVSQTPSGTPLLLGNPSTPGLSISADGRFVTFTVADASKAVPDEANGAYARAMIRADVLGPVGDTTAPPKPASIKVSQGAAGAYLSWPGVSDPSGPVSYRIRQRPIAGATHSLIGNKQQTTTSLTLRGLIAGQPYRFAVQAEDAQGNRSAATTVAFTAAGTPDATPPTVIPPAKPYVGTGEQQLGGPFTITGTDLGNVSQVLVGGQPATGLTITSTKITGMAPRSGDAASLPVTLIGPFGATEAGRFFYRVRGTAEITR